MRRQRIWVAILPVFTLLVGHWPRVALAEPPAKDLLSRPELTQAFALDRALLAEARNGSQLMANLTYLSDVIGPRLTGSANLRRANEWTAEKLKLYGLSNTRLEAWQLPIGWERGSASATIVEPDNGRSLTVAAMGWTPGTNGKIEGDVIVVQARNTEELKAYQGKLKGAIVLRGAPAAIRPITDLGFPFPAATPGERGRSEEKPGTPGQTPVKPDPPAARPGSFDNRPFSEMMRFRRELSDFLRKEGAAVLLMDSAKPHGLLNMTGTWGSGDRVSAADPLPTLFVTHEHYALLHRLATRPAPARTRLAVEISNKLLPGPLAVYNTVGEIRGSEKPDEFVVVGAHLDSWDLGQGTTDNGTGTCVILETARILAKLKVQPRRTIRFVLFSGEEQGLHGSKAYVQQHKDEMARTSAAIIHDTGTGRIVGLSLMGREALKPLLEADLASLKDLFSLEISPRSMGGSDHQSFEGVGVPGFMFRQDPAEYRLTHHSQSDTLDKAREPDLIQGAQVTAVLAMKIANRDLMLPREKKSAAPEAKPLGK